MHVHDISRSQRTIDSELKEFKWRTCSLFYSSADLHELINAIPALVIFSIKRS